MKVLVVEDDPRISDVLDYALKADGYEVVKAERGREAIELAKRSGPALIVLDVGLPDIDGFEVCRAVRKFSDAPIIFLTSRSDEVDRVVGLEIGGDDYVVKPFSPRELLARIKAIRRRHDRTTAALAEAQSEPQLRYGPITIDPEKFRVRSGGREIVLTAQEFKLLELLVRHPGRVFTREQVLNRAWGEGGLVADRTIDVHVKSLRKKFGKFDFIETVRGIGYRSREL
jgi:two-component system, OmpR family, response regulator